MNKTTLIVIVLVLILGIHGVVLYAFLKDGSAAKQAEEKAAEKTEKKQEDLQAFDGPAGPLTTREEYLRRRARTELTKPFDYLGAVNGDIKQLASEKPGRAGILVDMSTRKVLWAKNARIAVPIASMTKLMTVLVAYEMTMDPKSGITLDTPVKVSVAAYKIGGSQVYLDPKETFTIRELIMAASIKSANDAAYLLAEFCGQGDVQTFVDLMNKRAKKLGMTKTVFHNPHGLPGATSAEDNVSSPEDMVRLGAATLMYPQLVEWASTWKAPFRKPGTKGYIEMTNHNHLIKGADTPSPGVDGLKTGFINRAGYCLTVSCKRGGRRVIGVVMGHPSWKERDRYTAKLLNWGYARINTIQNPN